MYLGTTLGSSRRPGGNPLGSRMVSQQSRSAKSPFAVESTIDAADLLLFYCFHRVFARRSANCVASFAVSPYTDSWGLAPMLVGNNEPSCTDTLLS